ncbi:DUF1624 domain-containing protein [Azoarcus olearius]|uniref:Conserved hypothetical membrane protein n=1 Tax=Azoarcus sp. (strain BH72) TaxID=418699 RepID=A1K1Z3_AZOSB|nr:heparan-alpha-glucosaminide N-acetyltransferase domain-containing protein [Azoarcus olearius]CAL92848.1 conserved hypothetical membrane protein [Azoarcus olearius]
MSSTASLSSTVGFGPAAAAGSMPLAAVRAPRIVSIDILRGLVMLVMLLDHVRETLYLHLQVTDPMTIATTPAALFFSRFAAHFCAPAFVFLTGLSAWLYANPPAGTPRPVKSFLMKRGFLLLFLEATVITFAWSGDLPPRVIYLQVIWAIGLAMIVLALMSGLPRKLLAAIGFVIVFGHNALAGLSFAPDSPLYLPWTLLLHRGPVIAEGALQIKLTYPVLPWIGVILLGWVAGPLYAHTVGAARRIKLLLALGLACLGLLLVLRGFNIYGENAPWEYGATTVHTVMSFLNFTKYPPSLDFLLTTLGTAFLLLAAFERADNRVGRFLATFGGAPMFYYIGHLLLLLVLYKILLAVFGPNQGTRFGVNPDQFWVVWVSTVALIPVLYFPCRAFARYKRTSKRAWVRYF